MTYSKLWLEHLVEETVPSVQVVNSMYGLDMA